MEDNSAMKCCCPCYAVHATQGFCVDKEDAVCSCCLGPVFTFLFWEPKVDMSAYQAQAQANSQNAPSPLDVQQTQVQYEQCSTSPWYWVPCTKREASEAVLGVAPGGFIVRNSSKPGTHVLVVNDHGTLQNIQIHRSEAGFNLARGEPYPTIDGLIQSMVKGGPRPLLSKNPAHKGEHLYLRAGRVVSEEDAADGGSSA